MTRAVKSVQGHLEPFVDSNITDFDNDSWLNLAQTKKATTVNTYWGCRRSKSLHGARNEPGRPAHLVQKKNQ